MNNRIKEGDLIIPALKFLYNAKDYTLTTTELIELLTKHFNPSGEDAEILANRNDTKFSQKVRNLKSHNTLVLYAIYRENQNCPSGSFTLNSEGIKYITSVE